jgi:hypothetical protein
VGFISVTELSLRFVCPVKKEKKIIQTWKVYNIELSTLLHRNYSVTNFVEE